MQERSRLEGYDSKHTYEYLYQDAKARGEHIKYLEMKHLQENYNFTPAINTNSRIIADAVNYDMDFMDRMQKDQLQRKHKSIEKKEMSNVNLRQC